MSVVDDSEKLLVMPGTMMTQSEDPDDAPVQEGSRWNEKEQPSRRSKSLLALIALIALGAGGTTAGVLVGRGGDKNSESPTSPVTLDKVQNEADITALPTMAPIIVTTAAPAIATTFAPTLRRATSNPTAHATTRPPRTSSPSATPTVHSTSVHPSAAPISVSFTPPPTIRSSSSSSNSVPTVVPMTIGTLKPITRMPTSAAPMSFQKRFEGHLDLSPSDVSLITPSAIAAWEETTTLFLLRVLADPNLDPPIDSTESAKVNLLIAASASSVSSSASNNNTLMMQFRATCAFTSRGDYDPGFLATHALLKGDALYLSNLQQTSHPVFLNITSVSVVTDPAEDV